MPPHAGGLTVRYHSDTRQAPDAEKLKANTGGGSNLGRVKSQYDLPDNADILSDIWNYVAGER